MEQVRHGQDSWAQFDDDDSSTVGKHLSVPICTSHSYFPMETSSFINQQQTINSHFPNLGLSNQNLLFPSSLSQSNELFMLRNPSDPTSSPFAAIHGWSPRSTIKTARHENLNTHSEMNSSHCTDIQFHSHKLNNWSSFNQPIVQFKQQFNPTDITPLVNTAITSNTNTTNFSPNLNTSNDVYTVRNQRIVDPWAVTSDQKAYYLSQFLRLQPDISSKLSGLKSKTFFELSNLPSSELSKIWELSDLDHDGQLTLSEFCIAMHLVVYRLNGVPIPNNLPTVLLELVETNWLSTKLSSTSPTVKANTTTTSTTTTTNSNCTNNHELTNCTLNSTCQQNHISPVGYKSIDMPNSCQHYDNHNLSLFLSSSPISSVSTCQVKTLTSSSIHYVNTSLTEMIQSTNFTELKHHHHEPNQQQQRRWSLSSQSDVSSLLASEEGMTLFESKLNTNAQLKHPIPLRAKTLPSNAVPEMVNSMMSTTQDYSTVDHHQNDFLHTYQFPFNSNNDNKFCTAINNPMIESTPRLQPPPITIHSSPILFNSQHSGSITSPSSSVIQKAPPPPPPPRANLLLVTNIDSVHNDNMGQKSGVSLTEEKEDFVPSLTVEFNSEEMKLTESQQLYISPSIINNNNNNSDDNNINNVDILKHQCDSISQINEQLTTTLIKLQKDRIALKIFLERLMPLETI
ncbi:unnamed protein product [Schistosoma rodhaini]|uniref:RalBP1-associated Eps domain-containing protein n=1 Tax=Schistosoma rodhaini TaxID=6188 RepID=A0AA85G9M7_9TREM|nr:unnamed protein product [Schistosoma rodhaini]CAH8622514.1 unnamed protein product [Schistosoma rodhaini]